LWEKLSSYPAAVCLLSVNGDDLQTLDPLEMLAVIGQELESMVKARGGDHQVEVSDHQPALAETAALLTENLAYLVAHSQHNNAGQEIFQLPLAPLRNRGSNKHLHRVQLVR